MAVSVLGAGSGGGVLKLIFVEALAETKIVTLSIAVSASNTQPSLNVDPRFLLFLRQLREVLLQRPENSSDVLGTLQAFKACQVSSNGHICLSAVSAVQVLLRTK